MECSTVEVTAKNELEDCPKHVCFLFNSDLFISYVFIGTLVGFYLTLLFGIKYFVGEDTRQLFLGCLYFFICHFGLLLEFSFRFIHKLIIIYKKFRSEGQIRTEDVEDPRQDADDIKFHVVMNARRYEKMRSALESYRNTHRLSIIIEETASLLGEFTPLSSRNASTQISDNFLS